MGLVASGAHQLVLTVPDLPNLWTLGQPCTQWGWNCLYNGSELASSQKPVLSLTPFHGVLVARRPQRDRPSCPAGVSEMPSPQMAGGAPFHPVHAPRHGTNQPIAATPTPTALGFVITACLETSAGPGEGVFSKSGRRERGVAHLAKVCSRRTDEGNEAWPVCDVGAAHFFL